MSVVTELLTRQLLRRLPKQIRKALEHGKDENLLLPYKKYTAKNV